MSDFLNLCSKQEVKKAILSDLLRLGKEAGLKSFEQVRNVPHSTLYFVLHFTCWDMASPVNTQHTQDWKKTEKEMLQSFGVIF